MQVNDIVIRAEQTPGVVRFYNFEELKRILQNGVSVYNETEYTVTDLQQAEDDLHILKTVKKRLTDKKKELESAYTMPIEEVKKQIDELLGIVKAPLDRINGFIDDCKRNTKKQEILKYAEEKGTVLGRYAEKIIESDSFFNEKWLNKTYSTKNWRKDIDEIIINASDSIKTISQMGDEKKQILMGYFLDKLSLDGAERFLENIKTDVDDTGIDHDEGTKDNVIGYKVLKIYGTQREILKIVNMLELSDVDFEEIEDGLPQEMKEVETPYFDSFVCFDIEHTGTYGIDKGDGEAEIIEIGAVKVIDGQIADRFDMLANPGRKIVPRIARLTHITDEMVQNEPSVNEVIKKFREFVGDSILVGHNIKICDIPHISRSAKRAGVAFDSEYFDTKKYAMKYKDKYNWDNVKLTYLSEYFGIEQAEAHRAWCDAEANAYLYLKLRELANIG